MKIDGCSINAPCKTKRLVKKTLKEFQKANNEVLTKANKQGDVVILGYKDSKRDELSAASIIKPDGTQKMIFYYYYPAANNNGSSVKIKEEFDRVKDDLIFSKSTTMQYSKTKTPEIIPALQHKRVNTPEYVSVMHTDADLDDGVEIIKQYPLDKYLSIFRRPK